MTRIEKQRKIANWILERSYAEDDSPNSMTRAEIIELLEPRKEELRKNLSREYLKTFGEPYDGDIIEDTVLDIKTFHELRKLAKE